MASFRRNVALILTRAGGEILVCERSGFPGSWQFPQGGAKRAESDLQALHREVREEISLNPEEYHIVLHRGPYRYTFRRGFRKEGFDGQEQIYFLAEILGRAEDEIRVDREEFRAHRWIFPDDFLIDWVPPIKRDVYRAVFRDFFRIELG
jgi:putative (di)nucleoside polyphosphate hydrolase